MVANTISGNAKTTHRDRITWLLISGLLFFRFPVIIWACMDKRSVVSLALLLTAYIGTYIAYMVGA